MAGGILVQKFFRLDDDKLRHIFLHVILEGL
jgi:hypothetical protein